MCDCVGDRTTNRASEQLQLRTRRSCRIKGVTTCCNVSCTIQLVSCDVLGNYLIFQGNTQRELDNDQNAPTIDDTLPGRRCLWRHRDALEDLLAVRIL